MEKEIKNKYEIDGRLRQTRSELSNATLRWSRISSRKPNESIVYDHHLNPNQTVEIH